MKVSSTKNWLILSLLVILALTVMWLMTTNNLKVWPVRNALQYYVVTWWWDQVGQPAEAAPGTLQGTVRAVQGQPIAQAWVLISRWDGTTFSARSDDHGRYVISNVPAGTYRPVAGAAGYESVELGGFTGRVEIEAGADTLADVVLPPAATPALTPGNDLVLGNPETLSCSQPIASQAIRREVHFKSEGQPNQLSFYYTPVTATTTSRLPLLLTIYPGPADTWECVSLPLSTAGYGLLAVGPAYTFDLETDLNELERLLMFVREGRFPGSDGSKIALIGGSYSSLHVLRLLQRGQEVEAALVMGPPTDLFDMRRRLENGTFVPPFGLDRAFYALGFPDREPLRYWRYSAAYHVYPDFPPIAILHSRTDEVVPYQQGELLAAQLAETGIPYESHFFDGGGHYLLAEDGDADALEMYRITLDFLAKYLL